MVIARLIGGLGNQLFQYALGRTLAASRSTSLKLDISDYDTYKVQAYALCHFNVIASVATRDEIRRLRGGGWMAKQLSRRLHRLIPFRKDCYILEKGFAFNPQVLKSPGDVYLEGYWQSEKYFKSIEGVLRQEFTVRAALSGRNQEMAARIAQLAPDLVQLNKRLVHRQMEMMGMRTALRVGTELCALGTHQKSMHEFMKRVRQDGLTAALSERDKPFGDYRTTEE